MILSIYNLFYIFVVVLRTKGSESDTTLFIQKDLDKHVVNTAIEEENDGLKRDLTVHNNPFFTAEENRKFSILQDGQNSTEKVHNADAIKQFETNKTDVAAGENNNTVITKNRNSVDVPLVMCPDGRNMDIAGNCVDAF